MRVIAGDFKGRSLHAVPGKSTRPTSDKVKEALFSMIGPFFQGGFCLDLYAGTGALGIEGISRGIDKAIFIDQDKKAIETIWTNIKSFGLKAQVEVYRNDAERALDALERRGIQFDLIFIDPPYFRQKNKIILTKIVTKQLLKEQGIIVVEHDPDDDMTKIDPQLNLYKQQHYGDTALSIYNLHA